MFFDIFCLFNTHTHLFNGPLSGTTQMSWYQKGKTNLDFAEARDSGISWAICNCAPRSRQITTPTPHHSDFYRLDALPAAQPTVSKHWRDFVYLTVEIIYDFDEDLTVCCRFYNPVMSKRVSTVLTLCVPVCASVWYHCFSCSFLVSFVSDVSISFWFSILFFMLVVRRLFVCLCVYECSCLI